MTPRKRIRLKVASPCDADWNSMKGDDAVRHCGACKKNVYQLSNMSTEEVEALLASKSGETCVRFYQRKDGTVLADDCKVGVKTRRRKQAIVGIGAGLLSAFGLVVVTPASPAQVSKSEVVEVAQPSEADIENMQRLALKLLEQFQAQEPEHMLMGKMAPPEYVQGEAIWEPGEVLPDADE